jgi:hypothetical protein
VDQRLAALTYTEENLPKLTEALQAGGRSEQVALYVANKLLAPLAPGSKPGQTAKLPAAEIYQKALPAAKGGERRFGRYPDMPRYGPGALSAYEIPLQAPNKTPEELLKIVNHVQRDRQQKLARETPIAKQRELVSLLHARLFELMAHANKADEDDQLRRILTNLEREGNASFVDVLTAITTEAPRMDEKRAKAFYDHIASMASVMVEIPYGPKQVKFKIEKMYLGPQYTNYGLINLSSHENSVPAPVNVNIGVPATAALAALAGPAKQPPVTVLTDGALPDIVKAKAIKAGVPLQ